MKTALKLFVVAAVVAAGASAKAQLANYSPFTFDAQDMMGNLIEDGTFAVVIDLDGDGWGSGGDYLAQGNALLGDNNSLGFLWDADDLLVEVGPVGNAQGAPGFAFALTDVLTTTPGYDTNVDRVYFLWFELTFGQALTAGVKYGAELLPTLAVPTGGTHSDQAAGGPTFLTTVAPSSEVIPAPAALPAGLVLMGLIAARRRNRNA